MALMSDGEVAVLDPGLEVLGGLQVGGRIDGRARLLEDPVVDGLGRADGSHQVLERERQAHAARGVAPLHDRLLAGVLRLLEQRLELGQRLGRLGHADLGRQVLVVEHAGHAVVEAAGVERAVAPLAVRVDAVLDQLGRRPLVPAVGGHIRVEVEQQAVLDQADHGGQPDEVRWVVAGQEQRALLHQVRELVLTDIPGDVRELLGELLAELLVGRSKPVSK